MISCYFLMFLLRKLMKQYWQLHLIDSDFHTRSYYIAFVGRNDDGCYFGVQFTHQMR